MYAKTPNHYKDDDDGPVRISNEGFGERFLQLNNLEDDNHFSPTQSLQSMFPIGVGTSPTPISTPPTTTVQAGPSGLNASYTPNSSRRSSPRSSTPNSSGRSTHRIEDDPRLVATHHLDSLTTRRRMMMMETTTTTICKDAMRYY